jgi:hypothetical protein
MIRRSIGEKNIWNHFFRNFNYLIGFFAGLRMPNTGTNTATCGDIFLEGRTCFSENGSVMSGL